MPQKRYRFVPPGGGLDYDWTRDHTFVKVAAADTGGAYALMEDNLKREFCAWSASASPARRNILHSRWNRQFSHRRRMDRGGAGRLCAYSAGRTARARSAGWRNRALPDDFSTRRLRPIPRGTRRLERNAESRRLIDGCAQQQIRHHQSWRRAAAAVAEDVGHCCLCVGPCGDRDALVAGIASNPGQHKGADGRNKSGHE
jgi:hypothetical protein